MKKAEGTIISAISGYYDVEIDDKVVRTRARGVFRDRKQNGHIKILRNGETILNEDVNK